MALLEVKTSYATYTDCTLRVKGGKKAGKTGMIFASLGIWWTKMSTGTS